MDQPRPIGSDGTESQAGVDATEAEGVAEQVRRLAVATARRNDIEVAGGIPVLEVGGSWQMPALQGHGADRGLHRSGRSQRVTV